MTKKGNPETTHPVPANVLAVFVRGGEVIACERHAAAVKKVVERLNAGRELEDDLFLEFDKTLRCFECRLIANSVLGEPTGTDVTPRDVVAAVLDSLPENDPIPDASKDPPTDLKRGERHGSHTGVPRPLIIEPYLQDGPFCPTPVRLAARRQSSDILFSQEKILRFAERLPQPVIRRRRVPLVVTTPHRAQLEYLKGKRWRIAIPLAPQKTRIVTRQNSRLYDRRHKRPFDDFDLAARLGGCAIAVADRTSSYASRLALAAHEAGFKVDVCDSLHNGRSKKPLPPDKERSDDTLYLLVADVDAMTDLLALGKIDGFSTVEPYPTFAKFRLGEDLYAESVLGDECTSASSGFCCVVLVPAAWAAADPDGYDALLRVLIESILDLLEPEAIKTITPLLEEIVSRRPAVKKRGRHFNPLTIATQAAISTLNHLTDHLKPQVQQPAGWSWSPANLLVPDVTTEVILAEAGALCPYLEPKEQTQLRRGLKRFKELRNNLYDFSRARQIFVETLQRKFVNQVGFEHAVSTLKERVVRVSAELAAESWESVSDSTTRH